MRSIPPRTGARRLPALDQQPCPVEQAKKLIDAAALSEALEHE